MDIMIGEITLETKESDERPVHPGRILRPEMPARRLSANALALALRKPSGRITDILNGKRGVSPETALRLARLFRREPCVSGSIGRRTMSLHSPRPGLASASPRKSRRRSWLGLRSRRERGLASFGFFGRFRRGS